MNRNDEKATVDLVVVGSGAAGMTAALVAANQGLRVMLLEKESVLGGTTAYSAGAAWIPGTELAAKSGVPNGIKEAETYLDWIGAKPSNSDVMSAFLRAGPELVRFLHTHTEVQFSAPPFSPDYKVGPGSVEGGRCLAAVEFDGRRLGADLKLVRSPRPGFTILGDMMVGRLDIEALLAPFGSPAGFRRVCRILSRHAWARITRGRSTRLVMGNALVAMLLLSLRKAGVEIITGVNVQELLTDGYGRVVGVRMLRSSGEVQDLSATSGVVLATGGFGKSSKWRAELLPVADAGYCVGAPGLEGAGFDLARAVGGAVERDGHRSGAFWMPSSVLRQRDGSQLLFPHILLDRAKPGLIAVGPDGRRFVNEGDSYHDFCTAMFEGACASDGKMRPAWLVFDRAFLTRYGVGFVHPRALSLRAYRKAGYLVEAPTITGLAGKIGVPKAALTATVEHYNSAASAGVDEEFGKGSKPLNRQNGDPRVKPNPCLAPLHKAPFFAVAVLPATLATSAGLSTDHHARVLRKDGDPVEGLYAVGNDMASIMRGTYPGPGTTIGPAMVFGYLAAMHAAAQVPHDRTTLMAEAVS
jgi:succinate dehydrogenase/fumarate reductase flavoprotein subunit